MRRAVTWAVLAASAVVLALPVIGQEAGVPRSLLPDDIESAAPPAAVPATAPASGATGDTPAASNAAPPPGLPGLAPVAPQVADPFASPEATGRDITVAGPLPSGVPGGGYGLQIFADSNGRFLHGLMRRMNAPVASRWAHIALRRALLSESTAPSGINPADWIAGRAWLLVRMGEIDGAKALVDAVPVDRYSASLYKVAAQAAFAAADIGGVCPLAVTGTALSKDPIWPLSVAMCGAMQGDDLTAARVFDELRDGGTVDPFDIRLGERVATITGGGGRATNIDWNEAPALTPWRWGVATALGVAVPPEKLAALGPARFGWLVRAAAVPGPVREAALRPAAAIGIMSGDELVSAIAAQAAGQGDDAIQGTPAGRLRQAFAAASPNDRLAAIRAIWATGTDDDTKYAALIESAPAVLRIEPNAGVGEPGQMIAALLAVGAEPTARRWWAVARNSSAAAKGQAWALLATGATGGIPLDRAAFANWRSATAATPHRAALLVAGLTGLGRAQGPEWQALRGELLPDAANSWTRAIDAAAAGGRLGEVVVLAGTALQGRWTDVPPAHLQHLVAALARVGMAHEARMIAAEAVMRG